jgi:DNA modification methylase
MAFEISKTELVWPGKYDTDGNLVQSPRVSLPFQVIERVNETRATREAKKTEGLTLFDLWNGEDEGTSFEDGWRNKLIWGENAAVMGSLLEQFSGKIDLICIDPPFDVGADFGIQIQVGDIDLVKESSIIEEVAYRDTWGQGRDSYIAMFVERIRVMRELLSPDGIIAVHSDWRVAHHIRSVMDEIFGSDQLVNDLVWRYGKMSNATRRFPQNHDNICVYSKSSEYVFNPVKESDSEYKNRFERYVVDNKVKYEAVRDSSDKLILGRIRKREKELGREIQDSDILFDFDNEFKTQDDVFYDISIVKGNAQEKLDYPTQKPEALLNRIISAFSNPGDLVADFFCGSGTTLAVAEKIGRRWIGADMGRYAIHTSRKRLLEIDKCKPFEVLNLGKYERQIWSSAHFGEDLDGDGEINLLEYLVFVLKLYGAEAISGSASLHGRRGSAYVHVASVSSPVTIDEIELAVMECRNLGGLEVHVLGWEWEMGLHDPITGRAKDLGVKLVLRQIPREIMEAEAARKGQVKFFELAYLQAEIVQKNKANAYVCTLTDFSAPNLDLIPEEIREKITKWSDFVDYWAVDWNYSNDTFSHGFVTYRTRQDRNLILSSDPFIFESPGEYQVMIKVIDIFGNDTSKIIKVRVPS